MRLHALLNRIKASLAGTKAKLGDNNYFRSVITLVFGTAGSQAITLLCLPILTRLYNPEHFELFAVYVAFSTVLSSIACFRFEIAISKPKKTSEAINIVLLATVLCVLSSLLTLLVIVVLFHNINSLANLQSQYKILYYLIPLGMLSAGLYSVAMYFANRRKLFKDVAYTKFTQSISAASVQTAGGLYSASSLWLVIGQILSQSVGVYRLFSKSFRNKFVAIQRMSFVNLKSTFVKYKKFPKYSVLDSLFNTASLQLPIVLIAQFSAAPLVGYLYLALRLLQMPMTLIGSSVSQAFLVFASEISGGDELRSFALSNIKKLANFGGLFLLATGLAAYFLVPTIFGNEWELTAKYVLIMVPWFIFQFCASPISMIMHINGAQKQLLLLTSFGLIGRVGIVFLAYLFFPDYFVESLALMSFIYYVACYLVFSVACGVTFREAVKVQYLNLISSFLLIVFYFCSGLVV
ncbi:oligosaccharide flippase family protein [Rheinheimera pleomorphica]|uniref:oligosaccharide flippase family protein n=1 Tax=Rheinheimera pleomorphica TaxID=2703963 RepID=UPI0014215D3A|nr:oligosaccharide flippase family protein [Rheinheimera pleomorphica]